RSADSISTFTFSANMFATGASPSFANASRISASSSLSRAASSLSVLINEITRSCRRPWPGAPGHARRYCCSWPSLLKCNFVPEVIHAGLLARWRLVLLRLERKREIGLAVLGLAQPPIHPIVGAIDPCGAGPIRVCVLILAVIDEHRSGIVLLLECHLGLLLLAQNNRHRRRAEAPGHFANESVDLDAHDDLR